MLHLCSSWISVHLESSPFKCHTAAAHLLTRSCLALVTDLMTPHPPICHTIKVALRIISLSDFVVSLRLSCTIGVFRCPLLNSHSTPRCWGSFVIRSPNFCDCCDAVHCFWRLRFFLLHIHRIRIVWNVEVRTGRSASLCIAAVAGAAWLCC